MIENEKTKEKAVSVSSVTFRYNVEDPEGQSTVKCALNGISLDIEKGSYVAILGPNGSGKSTLAKIIDLLEMPSEGTVTVLGINGKDEEHFWDIRENCSKSR